MDLERLVFAILVLLAKKGADKDGGEVVVKLLVDAAVGKESTGK